MKWQDASARNESSEGERPSIGVTLLTGFLGSGKTTLLNHLLKDPTLTDTAVIINEFGDIAIDHMLVESSIENAVVLQNGCICCTVRGDLVDTLTDLFAKRERGLVPQFTRVAIETTGLADPSPIIRTFTSEKLVRERFHLEAVVATVDCVNGQQQLVDFEEARRQVALADVLILTKSDIAPPQASRALASSIGDINPAATVLTVTNGQLSASELADAVPPRPTSTETVSRWLKAEAFDQPAAGASNHRGEISTFSIVVDEPLTMEALRRWLASITSLRGADLLRMKGLIAISGQSGPMVVHAVQHVVHPPVQLQQWPTDDKRTKIVFITRNLPQEGLRRSFLALTGG
ncbi:GTP-binding protein [Aureimonas fodinaquatilis]|uniref:GTP-binding protein n=1 Tax=Aureimonas fodinaquatilis TaxID=2565783 RepID=A0A5B0DUW5_9HYPH|nr:GTP-binding protein [Aureimonas fodinaquatilis]KAA0969581.1 GTP-binding protein [Aureimonas fodinaquatilis]